MVIRQNSDFLFLFEAVMTNPNGDPDQENKPRMDYETSTLLVSDARRKRDCRDFLKQKGFPIFVDTLADRKVPVSQMFEHIREQWMRDTERFRNLLAEQPLIAKAWNELVESDGDDILALYNKVKGDKKKKQVLTDFHNLFLTEIIKRSLIDIRMFGSAMAVENVSRTYTGPVQITWGYSLHPVELVKSNTITTIMNDDSSTFGKKYKVHYACVAHYGTINKFNAQRTGMSEQDREIFRKALVQGMMANQTDSKQGQTPLCYLEVVYSPTFDGYLGDLRRFLRVELDEDRPIRRLSDIRVDFATLASVLREMKQKEYVERVIGWVHPFVDGESLTGMPDFESVDLWERLTVSGGL
ncbi:type I CRISPR-associated protein Cas7 [Geobacillus proteiniphilus]|uniref:CRISPR-associated protein, Csd2/Csh2 family n=1 Tax=Geobacillus proteiniphilus TaxID=860353 RepID=A0A1Q5T4V5_9BACL|nr:MULTISPECIES: type I CRISPR-associated protein Cas7 [Geobacillus]OKO95267.1 CRISPR-associated protein, Csd2/Csh2 family [Geobacillus proteiniphilus]OPX04211.1 CRISPR-associated protein [Geobacillus sp. LEMMY01]WMJ15911.1 type I CRISPR-associated protein Cas7 [Geobacillus proteiniphilus]